MSSTISLTNKVLKAFDIQVRNSAEAMDSLHTATMKTPLDLQKIDSAMKNAGASMRNFIESTSKQGKELEDYKQEILDLSLSLVGGQVSLGRTANSAGVSVRMLGTKLITLEKTAKVLFDSQMKLNNSMHEGEKVTADYLASLAQDDLPKAMELLSSLYTTGQLSIQVLNKMFTSRHAPYLISQLALINGNVDQYMESMTKGATVQEDYEKGMQSFSNQLKLLKNNWDSMNVAGSQFMDIFGTDIVKVLNHLLENIRELQTGTSLASHAFGALSDSFIASSVAVSGLITTMFVLKRVYLAIQSMGGLSIFGTAIGAPQLAIIAGVVAGVVAIASLVKRIQQQQQLRLEIEERIAGQTEKQIEANTTLLNILMAQKNQLVKIAKTDFTKEWSKAEDIISSIAKKSTQLNQILDATAKIRYFKLPELKTTEEVFESVYDTAKAMSSQMEKDAKINDKVYSKKNRQFEFEQKAFQEELKFLRLGLDIKNKNIGADNEEFNNYVANFTKKKGLEEGSRKARERAIKQIERESMKSNGVDSFSKSNLELGVEVSEKRYAQMLKDRAQSEKDFRQQLMREDEEYAKYYLVTQTESIKITEDRIKKSHKEMGKSLKESFTSKVGVDIAKNLNLDEIVKDDLDKADNYLRNFKGKTIKEAIMGADTELELKAVFEGMEKSMKEGYTWSQFSLSAKKLQTEEAQKLTQETQKLLSYYEQIAGVTNQMEADMFGDIAKKLDIRDISSYQTLADDLGFKTVGKSVGNLISKGFSESDITKLISDDTVLETVAFFDTIEDSIENLKNTSKETVEAFAKENADNGVWGEIAENYKDITGDLGKYTAYMKDQLEGLAELYKRKMMFVDPRSIKSTFYDDSGVKLEQELAKLRLKGLELMIYEQKVIKENANIEQNRIDFKIANLKKEHALQKGVFDLTKEELLVEKSKLEAKSNKQISELSKGIINKDSAVTREDVDKANAINDALEIKNQLSENELGTQAEILANRNKINDAIEKSAEEADKLVKAYDKINKSTFSYNDILNKTKGYTEGIVKGAIERNKEGLKSNAIALRDLKSKEKITDEDEIAIKNIEDQNDEYEKKLAFLTDMLKSLAKLNKYEENISKNLKEANAWRDKLANINKSSYELSKQEKILADKEVSRLEMNLARAGDDNEKSKISKDLAKARYDQEVATNKVLAARNNLINQSMDSVGQIINALAGADSSLGKSFGLLNSGVGLFTNMTNGMNAFQQIGSGFGDMQKGNLLSGVSTMLAGATPIVAVGGAVLGAISASTDKRNAKAEAEFKKSYDVATAQLNALTTMSGSLKTYSDSIVGILTKMPTYLEQSKYSDKTKSLEDMLKSSKIPVSDLSIKMKTGKDIKGKSKYDTYTYSADKLANMAGYGNLDDMSIDELEALENELKRVGDWGKWFKDKTWLSQGFRGTNASELVNQLDEFTDAYREVEGSTDEMMREATLKAFKSGSYRDVESTRKEFEDMAEDIFAPFKEVYSADEYQDMISEFVETNMAGIEDITTEASSKIRDGLIDGFAQALSTTDTLVGAFRNIFDEMAYDVNSVISDLMFEDMYDDIENITKEALDGLTNLKEELNKIGKGADVKGAVSDYIFGGEGYADKMIEVLKEAQTAENAMLNFNSAMREAMVQSGEFSTEFIEAMYPIESTIDDMTQSIMDMFSTALNADSFDDSLTSLGSDLTTKIVDDMINQAVSQKFQSKINRVGELISSAMTDGFSISEGQSLQNEVNKLMIQMQGEQNKILAMKDLLSFNMGDVDYQQDNNQIQYETGSTQTVTYNYYNTVNTQIGNLLGDESAMYLFVQKVKDMLPSV